MSKHLDPLAGRRTVVGLVSWVVLGVSWWLVLRRGAQTWWEAIAVPGVTLLVVTVLTLAWVRHNQGIYERKGPRRGVPSVEQPWTHDSLGRPLLLTVEAQHAQVVHVHVEGDLKRYEVVQ